MKLTDDELFALHRKAWEIEGDNAANARERYGRLVEAAARREVNDVGNSWDDMDAAVQLLREKADD